MGFIKCPVLVVGDNAALPGILVCLLEAGHQVYVLDEKKTGLSNLLRDCFSSKDKEKHLLQNLKKVVNLAEIEGVELAIALTAENLDAKKGLIHQLETAVPPDTLIAINSESIPLQAIREATRFPQRIIALNWTEPAHTTFFLEIVSDKDTAEDLIDDLVEVAQKEWQKDPYVLRNGLGIRSRMMAALVREAFGLIEEGYVGVEDIDRACRNDAGYYLPFSGHFRYMDLMGTYLYGIVMQELNPELSKATHIPAFFSELIQQGAKGMENNKGFYTYTEEEKQQFRLSFKKFTHEMKGLISHYSHDFLEKSAFEK